MPCQAIVSPETDLDLWMAALILHTPNFWYDDQEMLQDKIRNKFEGELLVGQATILSTNDRQIPYLIAAPTMSVPMRCMERRKQTLITRCVQS